jgi:formate dehydrogenase major subunit
VEVPKEVGYKTPEMFVAAKDGALKALWIIGEDVVQTDPNSEEVREALRGLDFLVVQELFMCETARMAHVVLPAASFLEKSGTFTNGERRIQRVNQAIQPLPGTKPDGQIIVDIMNRMGYEQEGYDPNTLLREISQVVPFFKGIRWDELGKNGKQWPVAEDGTDTRILHTETFKRGRGKFHFYNFEESAELLEHGNEFPFILTTGRILQHYNCGTMTRRTDNSEIVSEDVLLIHPTDAEERGIVDGDSVRLFSPRGETILSAALSENVKRGVLFTSFHFPEGMVNRVTGSVSDSETLCPEYKVVSVDIEKAQ